MDNSVRTQSTNTESNMGKKLLDILVLLTEILSLLVRWIYYTVEALFRAIIPVEEQDVTNKVVLITGTGHGIGRELALQYSQLGAKIVCIDINESGNNETVKEIIQRGGKAFSYICDVTDRTKIFELAKTIKSVVGTVSILINNAGIMPTHPILEQSENEIRKTFEINVYAHFWLIQAFLPDMIANNDGHIVALSSVAGLTGLKNLVPYCGSKFAVRGYMEALMEELRNDTNVKCTVIYPYMVDTGLCKKPHYRFEWLMRLLKPSQVAAAIIQAQRRAIECVTLPKYLIYIEMYTRLFPQNCSRALSDFLDTGVHAD